MEELTTSMRLVARIPKAIRGPQRKWEVRRGLGGESPPPFAKRRSLKPPLPLREVLAGAFFGFRHPIAAERRRFPLPADRRCAGGVVRRWWR
jgi:hypothetical protein